MIKIIAVLCSLTAPFGCRETTVTSSDIQGLSMHDCYNVAALAEWMQANHRGQRLAGWKCQIGNRVKANEA